MTTFLLLIACGIVGGLLFFFLHIPGGAMLGAVVAVLAVKMLGHVETDTPHLFQLGAQIAIGVIALAFQVVGVLYNGWSFLLLTCVGYIPGFFVYAKARKDRGYALTNGEKVGMGVVSALGIAALVLVGMGVIGI